MKKPKVKFWQRSPIWQAKRKLVNMGAFSKWAKAHPEEHQRIEERFRREQEAGK